MDSATPAFFVRVIKEDNPEDRVEQDPVRLELCRRLTDCQPGVVVVLITAFLSIAPTGAAAGAGVRCFVRKPVNFSVLMPLVEEAVGSG